MNFPRVGIMCAQIGMSVAIVVGCASHKRFPESSLTGRIFEVKIEEAWQPAPVTATRGDEVRWLNMSNRPVDVSVVQTREELISCQKGFASADLGYLFGTSEYENIVTATVRPNEFASLCFAHPGKYVYTLRKKHPFVTGSEDKITGTIIVE
ncbi:MAG TPA: hypothetical protein VJL88_10450 [Nitrospira sp.]|nr:hypothetical protein [Nitrospira sp.]